MNGLSFKSRTQNMRNFNTIRTLLFTPATRPERFLKGREIGADGVIVDLEDAVSFDAKDAARKIALDYFASYNPDPNYIQALRINSTKTPAGINDLAALINQNIRPDLIVIPKVEYAGEIAILDAVLAPHNIPYMPMIESALGLINAVEIAQCSPNVGALIFGGGDMSVDLGAEFTWEPLLMARCEIVRATAAAGICAIDVPYIHLHDPDDTKVIEETERVKALGYTGKLAIHPKHIKPIINTFTPNPKEIAQAKRIVDAYEAVQGNACQVDGQMIDVPIYRLAKRTLGIAKL